MKRINLAIFLGLGLLNSLLLSAQNNPIFGGGDNDGFASASLQTNNPIFGGGNEDGFAFATLQTNNSIFNGGDNDGFAFATLQTNNSIFNGGDDDGFGRASTAIWQFSPAKLKVFLQGSYNGTDMNDALRTATGFPMQEPYTAMGYTLQNEGCRITSNILESHAIVDWVLVQLRATETEVVLTKAALLKRDGDIVDIDGSSLVQFINLPQRPYHIVILHRNHSGVMAAQPLFISAQSEK